MPSIARAFHQGLAADKPTADATLNQGWMYYETDTTELKQSWNGSWVTINGGMFANITAKLDDQVVGGGGAAAIAFNAIDQTFSSLRVEITGATDTNASGSGFSLSYLKLQINADATTAHYRRLYDWVGQQVGGTPDASEGVFDGESPLRVGVLADPRVTEANLPGQNIIDIPDYTSTVFGKVGRCWAAVAPATYEMAQLPGVFTWDQTTAITDLVFTPSQGLFVAGTRARLYGTK